MPRAISQPPAVKRKRASRARSPAAPQQQQTAARPPSKPPVRAGPGRRPRRGVHLPGSAGPGAGQGVGRAAGAPRAAQGCAVGRLSQGRRQPHAQAAPGCAGGASGPAASPAGPHPLRGRIPAGPHPCGAARRQPPAPASRAAGSDLGCPGQQPPAAPPRACLPAEVVELCRYLEPSAEEERTRREAVQRLSDAVTAIWPSAEVHVFGSFATGARRAPARGRCRRSCPWSGCGAPPPCARLLLCHHRILRSLSHAPTPAPTRPPSRHPLQACTCPPATWTRSCCTVAAPTSAPASRLWPPRSRATASPKTSRRAQRARHPGGNPALPTPHAPRRAPRLPPSWLASWRASDPGPPHPTPPPPGHSQGARADHKVRARGQRLRL